MLATLVYQTLSTNCLEWTIVLPTSDVTYLITSCPRGSHPPVPCLPPIEDPPAAEIGLPFNGRDLAKDAINHALHWSCFCPKHQARRLRTLRVRGRQLGAGGIGRAYRAVFRLLVRSQGEPEALPLIPDSGSIAARRPVGSGRRRVLRE